MLRFCLSPYQHLINMGTTQRYVVSELSGGHIVLLEQDRISDPFILKSIVKIHLFDIIRLGLNQDSLFKWLILVLLLCVIHPSMYHFFKRDQRFLSFDIYSSNYILILCHKSKHLHVCGNGGAQQFHVEMKPAEN